MKWTDDILKLIEKAGFENIQPIKFTEHFLTCEVGDMFKDAKTNKKLAAALLQHRENNDVYLECLLYELAPDNPKIAIELAKSRGILSDVQKIEFEEISTADRLAKLMNDTDDEI